MTTKFTTLFLAMAAGAIGCGDNGGNGVTCGDNTVLQDGVCVGNGSGSGGGLTCGAGTMDNGSGMCVPSSSSTTYVQVEQIGRPGINEALLITDGYLNGYNATAPTFTGVDQATLGAVVGEAKTVLESIYLGTCLINGLFGLDPGNANAFKPGGLQCVETGPNMFSDAGTTLKTTVAAGAQTYADTMFNLFEPDVMRIDTSRDSGYFSLCGMTFPALCGGRLLTDDIIDITLNFLLSGGAVKFDPANPNDTSKTTPLQFRALASDGVGFSEATVGAGQLQALDTSNPGQGHHPILTDFPYAATPY